MLKSPASSHFLPRPPGQGSRPTPNLHLPSDTNYKLLHLRFIIFFSSSIRSTNISYHYKLILFNNIEYFVRPSTIGHIKQWFNLDSGQMVPHATQHAPRKQIGFIEIQVLWKWAKFSRQIYLPINVGLRHVSIRGQLRKSGGSKFPKSAEAGPKLLFLYCFKSENFP